MKHLNKLFVAMLLLTGISSQAQDSNNPWAITFGVNAVDTSVSDASGDLWNQYWDIRNNWNILPSISYLTISKYVGSNFTFGITGSVNKISNFVYDDEMGGYPSVNPGDLPYYAVDGVINYSLMNLIKSKHLDPSLHFGGGYTWLGDASAGTVNGGLGLAYWFNDFVGLSLRSTYKGSFDDTRTPDVDVASHMQHFLGIGIKFGGKDTDNDGIYDKDDACPEVPGLKQFNGCPDTDGDGITDASDNCPDVFGPAEYNGCPDTDGDGIVDVNDACPEVAGIAAFKGCPDTDGDGIQDSEDKCPNEKGTARSKGCPDLDADKDGIADLDDECPTVAGPASNKGCPEVTEKVLEELKIQARAVYFNTGKSTFQGAETEQRLAAIREILKNYPNAKFEIQGHTDDVGKDASNLALSQKRADAVRDYMISKGINPDNLTAKGYGETMPVADNKTKEGKAQNRRTEVKHIGSAYEGKL